MIVAIDGPAASGKSTAAIGVAKALNITHLDTGSMYRAVTYGLISNQISFKDTKSITKFLESLNLRFSNSKKGTDLILNNSNVTSLIRTNIISENVSEVSAIKIIREFMVRIQRQMASDTDCILEGRDIGTVVFPNADFKFFMTADEKSRAERRLIELVRSGDRSATELDNVLDDLKVRDHKDSTRNHSPLIKAKDALVIDTTYLTINEVIDKIVNTVNQKRTLY
jgi:cytidylate kinase|tara:strand:+ start:2359 stop:3033 length:675 start_codon:yes stop_codon:yes gene_type:complete